MPSVMQELETLKRRIGNTERAVAKLLDREESPRISGGDRVLLVTVLDSKSAALIAQGLIFRGIACNPPNPVRDGFSVELVVQPTQEVFERALAFADGVVFATTRGTVRGPRGERCI